MKKPELYHQSDTEKVMWHDKVHKDILLMEAVFSDETDNFRIPQEPNETEPIHISIRTGLDNVEEVYLCFDEAKIIMTKSNTKGLFDFYRATLPPGQETIDYYFELIKNNKTYYYTKKGFLEGPERDALFSVIRNFETPDWAKGAVIYQIFVDRFYNGDRHNDVKTNEYKYLGKPVQAISDWYQPPEQEDIRNFYGGDLQGVLEKLDYIQDLGIEAIYFNPLFVSPSNHKYDTQDYDYIDPHIGVILEDGGEPIEFEQADNCHASMYIQRTTDQKNLEASNAFFATFVEEAHKRGIRVILDGVFNHCGGFHKWLDREGIYDASGRYPAGAFLEKESKYHNYFRWKEDGTYEGWWGFANHPKLNFEESEELCQYILEVGKKWVSPPFCADGWRLDVAADLGYSREFNHSFWKRFREAVKQANPDAIILAEHYGDAAPWLQGDQWDTIMNYDAFMEPISWFLTGMEKHSEEFQGGLLNNGRAFVSVMEHQMAQLSIQSLQTSMNELSNHDHSRFLTRTNQTVGRIQSRGHEGAEQGTNKGVMKLGVLIQMTWPGCPTIYYGDEVGLKGWTDPDNRRTYPWGREDRELLAFHKEGIRIHKTYIALKTGSLVFLDTDYGVLSYGRFYKEEKLVILLNNTEVTKQLEIPVWQVGIMPNGILATLLTSDEQNFSTKMTSYSVRDGKLAITMGPFSGMILKEV